MFISLLLSAYCLAKICFFFIRTNFFNTFLHFSLLFVKKMSGGTLNCDIILRRIRWKEEKRRVRHGSAKNAACGDGHPRVRRWQFPRAAFETPPAGMKKASRGKTAGGLMI